MEAKQHKEFWDRSPEENRAIYDLSAVKHEYAKNYGLTFLNRGGEHLVYNAQFAPQLIVKIQIESLKEGVQLCANGGYTTRHLDMLREQAEEIMQRHSLLKSHFGSAAVPKQVTYVREVPVTGAILDDIHKGSPPARPASLPAIVTEQDFCPAYSASHRVDLVAGYAELRPGTEPALHELNEDLVLQRSLFATEKAGFLEGQAGRDLQDLVREMESDPALRTCVAKTITLICEYTRDTGEILDLAGNGNLLFFKAEKGWQSALPDALYPSSGRHIDELGRAILKVSSGEKLDNNDYSQLLNGLNFVRCINGMAALLQLNDCIAAVDTPLPDDPLNLVQPILERYKR